MAIVRLARRWAAALAALSVLGAGAPSAAAPAAKVLPGIDVLQAQGDAPIRGQRVGLVTHAAAVNAAGTSDIDVLARDPRLKLVTLFAPEHGIRSDVTRDWVAEGRDERTGLPVHSLYGTTKEPTADQLGDLDALVFDLQDVGARFYTYTSTMVLCLRACAREHKRFVVLDRPNPITGRSPEGGVLEPGFTSFVGEVPIPIRHALTVGELARFVNATEHLGCDLVVVPMQGWRRDLWFDQTGLPWIKPSPAMKAVRTATVYPGVCFFEATNVLCRATDRPFEWVGAPWVDGQAFARALNAYGLPGVHFQQGCWKENDGVDVVVDDRDSFRPVITGLVMVSELHRRYPDRVKFETRGFDQLAGNDRLLAALRADQDLKPIAERWEREDAAFWTAVQPYLLYR